MKERIIIFGASKLGEMSYIFYNSENEIICFCDNDKYKIGNSIYGKRIIAPEDLKKYENIKIIIASEYYTQIVKQLLSLDITNFERSKVSINFNQTDTITDLDIQSVNLGKFLEKADDSLQFNNLAFVYGIGSGILDYAFLRSLILNLNLSTYLEIGTFLGESIDAVSDITKKCYSVSLPNKTLDIFLARKGKENFGRYFSYSKRNVIHYEEDSQTFDYNIIKDKIDLVFIDGDHSYKGIYVNTKNIFNFINKERTIVVWHDFKSGYHYRADTVNAIFDALPIELHSNIYDVDNNICAIYIPDMYKDEFNFENEPDILYSYRSIITPKRNSILNKYYCPVCDENISSFLSFNNREHAKCPKCSSLERHRLIWLYFKEKTNIFTDNIKMIHIAPEYSFWEILSKQKNIDYLTADINGVNKYVKVKMDIQAIEYEDNTFDVIYCSHVLEHVPNDLQAMKELRRVLKPSGWAILQVPINYSKKETLEKEEYNTPELRTKYYGQHDHVRYYGRDYKDKLVEAGFIVEEIDYLASLDSDLINKYGLVGRDDIFLCKK